MDFIPLDKDFPDYSIYRYTDQIYKIVYFKNKKGNLHPLPRNIENKHDNKLSQSLSRSRKVLLELALCNPWSYFCTFTLDKNKYQRDDLPSFYKDFTQFIRDLRKKYRKSFPDIKLDYVLVPEEHKDGSWHMHGLLSNIDPFIIPFHCEVMQGLDRPFKLLSSGYFNWPDYQNKFGFCSLGRIQSPIATGFYISKYITKQIEGCTLPVNAHAYYCSSGLNRSSLHGDIYGYCSSLEQFLLNDFEYCKTGFTHLKDGLDWSFALEYMDQCPDLITSLSSVDKQTADSVDQYVEYTQLSLEEYE